MDGFKLIKTTFNNKKEIVGVNFDGDESYNLFIKEGKKPIAVKKVFNIPKGSEVQVYSKDFVVKPNIFIYFVAQYLNNLDFVLDIKVTSTLTEQTKNIATTESYSQKIPTTKEIESITEIHELLSFQTLENKHRTRIAKVIICSILDESPDRRLLRDEFLQLAQSIVEIFKTEVKETYYVPFTKGQLAKGKLYDAYNNKRARLSSSGLIRRRIKFKQKPAVVPDDSHIFSDSDVDENQLEILKSGCADWDLIREIWKKSYYFRKNESKYENLDPIDYMEKYKVLQHGKNYELFEIDFEMLYPASKSIYEWRLYYHIMIDKAEKVRDNSVKEILTLIQKTWNDETKLAISLLLVPYLLPTSRHKTKSEVQESFISYRKNTVKQEDDDDDNSNQSAKRLKLDQELKVCFIGDSESVISYAYMDFFGRRHIFQDPLQAVEVCFRCFLATHTKYPKFSEHVWLFIQKLVFQINTPDDPIIPSTNTLINDMLQQVPAKC